MARGPKIDPSTELTKTCKVCGETVTIKTQKGVPLKAYLDDPFCSSECAREFYNNPRPQSMHAGTRKSY